MLKGSNLNKLKWKSEAIDNSLVVIIILIGRRWYFHEEKEVHLNELLCRFMDSPLPSALA